MTKQIGNCLHGEIAGDLPRSGGLISPFCSNIARRFLTALMVADFQEFESQDLMEKLRSAGPRGGGCGKVAGAVGSCGFCSRQSKSTRSERGSRIVVLQRKEVEDRGRVGKERSEQTGVPPLSPWTLCTGSWCCSRLEAASPRHYNEELRS